MRLNDITHFRKIIGYAAVMLMIFSMPSLFAQNSTVDDCEHEKAQNLFGSYWYIYDDNPNGPYYQGIYIESLNIFMDTLLGGTSLIENFEKLNVTEYEEFDMTAPGNPNGTAGKCAMMAFQFGDTLPHYGLGESEIFGCYVGLGTGVISEGKALNLTGATKIKYWARASDTITAAFIVATMQGTFKNFGTYYQIGHKITPTWQQYSVYLREKDPLNPTDTALAQPKWALDELASNPLQLMLPWETDQHAVLPLNISVVTLLEWELGGAGEVGHVNTQWNMLPGTLWVDDIVIENYTWYPEDALMECDTAPGIGATLFGNPILLTNGGWYNLLDHGAWYAYNDAQDRDVSIPVAEYSWVDTLMANYIAPDSTIPQIKLLDSISGYSQTFGDTGAYISYILGPKYKKVSLIDTTDTNEVEPFVGIGLSLCNENDSTACFNAESLNIEGIYFDYWMTGDDKWLHVAFLTKQKFLEEGARFYVKAPSTNGVWRGAIIPFENLDLPPWDDIDTATFDPSILRAIQWSVEGDSGNVGAFKIDNVYLLDTANVGIEFLSTPSTHSRFSVKLLRNKLVYTVPQGAKTVIAQLYNLQGRRIISHRTKVTGAKSYRLPITTNELANGVYIFRLKAIGDKKKVFTKPITILK